MRRSLASILLLLAPFTSAWSITVTDLPAQLQTCVGGGTCLVAPGPTVTIGAMEAYRYFDFSAGTTGYALRYTLLPPSGVYDYDVLALSYTGDVWLTVQDSYDLAGDSNRITVYTDTVSPTPGNLLSDSDGLDIDIDLTNAALLSGAGHEISGLDYQLNTIYQANMTLRSDQFFSNALNPCLAEGCLTTALLNLLYVDFVDAGNGTAVLSFDPADTRALLYQITSEYPELPINGGHDIRQSYYVAAVPAPAALWLFLSGLGLLGVRLRRVSAVGRNAQRFRQFRSGSCQV